MGHQYLKENVARVCVPKHPVANSCVSPYAERIGYCLCYIQNLMPTVQSGKEAPSVCALQTSFLMFDVPHSTCSMIFLGQKQYSSL